MKQLLSISIAVLLVLGSACSKSNDDYTKPGVSLPTVSDLTLVKAGGKKVKLSWKMPASIPDEIQQPLSIYVEVIEVLSVMRTLPVSTETLPDAPTEHTLELPDAAKTYHITVKVFGVTKQTDPNYSSNIYSPGQTAEYTQ
jgi:hypothetical protein